MSQKKVIAYCFTKNLKKMTEEDIKLLDVVHIAFGLIKEGEVVWKGKSAALQIKRIRQANPAVRIVLSIGGWGADGFSQAAMTRQGREKAAASALRLVEEYQLDGLDIDWEYPCIGVGGIQSSPEDKENYTLLLKELRRQLDTCAVYKTLSIAAGGDDYFIASTNMGEAGKYLDYVQLMTYDLRGGFQNVTGHHANLYSYQGDLSMASTDRIVRLFIEAGVAADKLAAGVAFYGRRWKGVKAEKGSGGLCRVAGTTGSSFLDYDEVEALVADQNSGYQKYWDEQAQAAWVFDGSNFISYEDERAITGKAEYVKKNDMYGIMYWEYALDKEHTLTKLLHDTIHAGE